MNMQKTILIVDDDVQIGNLEQEMLEKEGYRCSRAYSGTEASLILDREKPDLILLDLMLPGLSGEEVLSKIKGIPVIVVSAKVGVDDKVSLLQGGASDYITKPFNTRELLARVEVQLRRTEPQDDGILRCGELALDTVSHMASAGGGSVSLTKTEYAILKLLMQNAGRVIAKPVILERIGEDTLDCTESSLKTHVSHLRTKLRGISEKDFIEAVWGIGFKFSAD